MTTIQSYSIRRDRLQITIPILTYRWPEDAGHVLASWWRAGTAAKAWGCSYRCAVRWYREHAGALALIRLYHAGGLYTHWVCVAAGQLREAAAAETALSPLVAYALRRARATTVTRQLMAAVPVMRYTLPRDRATVAGTYWTSAQAARSWGCSYQTARRWLLRHPEHAVMLQLDLPSGRTRSRLCMLAGQERTRSRYGDRGNPAWRDSATQSALASRRWKRRRLAPPPASPDAPPWE